MITPFDPSKTFHLVLELQVELDDPLQLRAKQQGMSVSADGDPELGDESIEHMIAFAVMARLRDSPMPTAEKPRPLPANDGLVFRGGSVLYRKFDLESQVLKEFVLPELDLSDDPPRRDS